MTPNFGEVLELLRQNDVELIVVGMTAAILQGAPGVTLDIDIVHRRTPENVERLLRTLESLDAVYRTDNRRIRPTASHLLGTGHNLLQTRLGDLDCLGTIDDGLGYDELEPDSVVIKLGGGLHCRALGLAKLIEVKQRAGRKKDLMVVPVLQATLELQKRR